MFLVIHPEDSESVVLMRHVLIMFCFVSLVRYSMKVKMRLQEISAKKQPVLGVFIVISLLWNSSTHVYNPTFVLTSLEA